MLQCKARHIDIPESDESGDIVECPGMPECRLSSSVSYSKAVACTPPAGGLVFMDFSGKKIRRNTRTILGELPRARKSRCRTPYTHSWNPTHLEHNQIMPFRHFSRTRLTYPLRQVPG